MGKKKALSIFKLLGILEPKFLEKLSHERFKKIELEDDILLELTGTDPVPVSQHVKVKKEEDFPKESFAKIIPLREEQEDVSESSKVEDFLEIEEGDVLSSAGIFSAEKLQKAKEEQAKLENQNKKSTAVFILDEREKIKKSKSKLSELDAIRAYQLSLNVDFHEDPEEEEEELFFSDSKGILINKKQF